MLEAKFVDDLLDRSQFWSYSEKFFIDISIWKCFQVCFKGLFEKYTHSARFVDPCPQAAVHFCSCLFITTIFNLSE